MPPTRNAATNRGVASSRWMRGTISAAIVKYPAATPSASTAVSASTASSPSSARLRGAEHRRVHHVGGGGLVHERLDAGRLRLAQELVLDHARHQDDPDVPVKPAEVADQRGRLGHVREDEVEEHD